MVHDVCCVPGCKNNSEANPDLSYHAMPYRDQLRKESSIGTPKLFVKPCTTLKSLRVSSKHFTANQYRYPGSKRLNTGTVPRIFEPLTLTLPSRLSALLRESTQNTEDTPTIDSPVTCEIPQYKLVVGPGGDELSESSDHSTTENLPTTHAEVTSNIAELRELLIFKDSDNVTDCIESSNTTEFDREIFIGVEEHQQDNADSDDCAVRVDHGTTCNNHCNG